MDQRQGDRGDGRGPLIAFRHRALRDRAVVPDVVEFWQAATTRVHVRLRYEREGAGWQRRQLWS
ncbi:pyridoxine 5'-phosphate oxidase C-terminal domain-containing protein [Streptomyces sp. NPDC093546]|uniref:pyridoxine 5'-phosphate oxidase C-terminal domain-containing protein n=1 Tax=Streptomyces sp. NPDC093546 TaxID=3366040 RepID=UPI0038112744